MRRHTERPTIAAAFRRRGGLAAIAVCALLPALAVAGGVGTTEADAAVCANEERRVEQGAPGLALPDCRAYELVSPGGLLAQESRPGRASLSGDAVTYYTTFPALDAESSAYFYLANRGAGGWSIRSIAPQNAPAALFEARCEQNVFFSPDLTRNIDEEGWFDGGNAAFCKRNENVLVPGEPTPYRNVFLHDVASDSYQLMNVTPAGVTPANAKFQDASDDFSRILFSEEAKLTSEAPAGYNLFIWSGGVVRLVTFLPDGTPARGELAEGAGYAASTGGVTGSGLAPATGAVSADGSRAFFYSGSGLYMRQNPYQPQSEIIGGECSEAAKACTVQIDATQGPGASGGGVFWRATSDGSKVFFTGESKLTGDSTAEAGKADLYEYDVASGNLVDLTVNGSEPADVRGVSGASEDGSYVYFVANGVLAPGATPGNCRGGDAMGQICNLYVVHEGSIAFVATLAREDQATWQESGGIDPAPRAKFANVAANASPNGEHLAFTSRQSLTGYDNHDATEGTPNPQLFVYEATANAGAGQLRCVSCIPSGAQPEDPNLSMPFARNYGPNAPGGSASWRINAVHDDGTVIFDTEDGLLAADENSARDVYKYRSGEHWLISGGTHPSVASFLDASADGSDIFFRTAQSLVGADIDNDNVSLYDARVGGGFPDPPPDPTPCEGEACRDAAPPPPAPAQPGTSVVRKGDKGKKPNGGKRCRRGKRQGKASRRCKGGKRRGKHASRRAGAARGN